MPEHEAREPSELPSLKGEELFSFGPTVLEFWRWALGDLRMNTARGYLAEFRRPRGGLKSADPG